MKFILSNNNNNVCFISVAAVVIISATIFEQYPGYRDGCTTFEALRRHCILAWRKKHQFFQTTFGFAYVVANFTVSINHIKTEQSGCYSATPYSGHLHIAAT